MANDVDQRTESLLRQVNEPEIIIPHEREVRPTTAVKYALLHSSLKKLEELGFLHRYMQLADPQVVEQVRSGLPSAWAAIELAHAHYGACDELALSADELSRIGWWVGDSVQATMLVSTAKKTRAADFEVWSAVGQLHRMWARLYQGGSVQVVKLGPKKKLLEIKGFTLNRHRYFRHAQLAALAATYAAVGNQVDSVKIVHYHGATDELQIGISWS